MSSVGSVMLMIFICLLMPVLVILMPFEYFLNIFGWCAGAATIFMAYIVISDGDYGFKDQLKWIIPAIICAACFGLGYVLEGKNIVDIWRWIVSLPELL